MSRELRTICKFRRWNEIRTRRNIDDYNHGSFLGREIDPLFDRGLRPRTLPSSSGEIRDVPQATVTNVFVYRQPGRRGVTRGRVKCREGVETSCLERAGYDTYVKQGIRFFGDA